MTIHSHQPVSPFPAAVGLTASTTIIVVILIIAVIAIGTKFTSYKESSKKYLDANFCQKYKLDSYNANSASFLEAPV